MIDEARKVMKWCQRGVRNADEGNSLAAECYGTIGKLVLEIERLNKAPPEAVPSGMVLMPVEPTRDMLKAANAITDGSEDKYVVRGRAYEVYKAMIESCLPQEGEKS